MAAFNTISPAALMRLIGTRKAPLLIDVRLDDDFDADPHLIPTARRWPHGEIEALLPEAHNRMVVVICQKGLKLSHGAAALLRCHGIDACVAEGGTEAWQQASLPRVPSAAIATDWTGTSTLWVTRQRPKIDRIACPWLIRRFVDPRARFLFVPAAEVAEVAARFSAIAFDTPEAPWTHVAGHCSFDAMIAGFGLSCAPLNKMAQVVRAADTGNHALAAEAAGLLALSVGLSRAHKDDLEQLEDGMVLYDALFRWARDGAGETHSWPEAHVSEPRS